MEKLFILCQRFEGCVVHGRKKMRLIGICINISDTGMQIIHTKKVTFIPSQRVRFFIDPTEVASFWAIGEVARLIPTESKAAFHFETANDLAALKAWLSKIQRRLV